MNNTVILATRHGMGHTDVPGLAGQLLEKYLNLLLAGNSLPAAICFYTDGVRLVATGSPVLQQLRDLEARGVRLISCTTCLDAMGLRESLQVGIAGGMTDILEAEMRADKVITI